MTALLVEADRRRAVASLGKSLHAEVELLADLSRGLAEQRQAIAADDTGRLEQMGQQLSRTLLTLREARRERMVLVELLAGDPAAKLRELLASVDPESAEALRGLSAKLRDTAVAVNRDLQVNQTVIRRSIESGERLLQHLLAAPAPDSYGPQPASGREAVFLNQRA